MKASRFTIESILVCFLLYWCAEAFAVRPPLKPLDLGGLRGLVADAELIAVGTVASVTQSKTVHQPRETVLIRAVIRAERILKGDNPGKFVVIEESYEQFKSDESKGSAVTAQRAGPVPQVGTYRKGERVLVFLRPVDGSNLYRPLGSGNQDAYLGVFQVTSGGVEPDRYKFDPDVSKYAQDFDRFLNLIASMAGEQT